MPPTKQWVLYVLLAIGFFACNTHKVYISPQVGLTAPYKSLPFRTDSHSTQLTANVQMVLGNANFDASDNVTAVNGYTQIAKRWGFLVVHANLGATLGNYQVFRFRNDRSYDIRVSETYNEQIRGNYFFGSASGAAGISLTAVGSKSFEWRPLGVLVTANKEFGSYAALRQRMDASKVSHIIRTPFLATAGVESEIVFRNKLWSLSFLLGQQWLLGKHYTNIWEPSSAGWEVDNRGRYRFFYSTMAVQAQKNTFYGSFIVGNRFTGLQLGFNRTLKTWR